MRQKLAADPAAPPTAYMAQVIRNKLTDLIRERTAEKRAGEHESLSLDAALEGSDDSLTSSTCWPTTSRRSRTKPVPSITTTHASTSAAPWLA